MCPRGLYDTSEMETVFNRDLKIWFMRSSTYFLDDGEAQLSAMIGFNKLKKAVRAVKIFNGNSPPEHSYQELEARLKTEQ